VENDNCHIERWGGRMRWESCLPSSHGWSADPAPKSSEKERFLFGNIDEESRLEAVRTQTLATLEDLERKVQLLEDERALRSLLARLAFNADLGRTQEYVNLFTESGVIDGAQRYEGQRDIAQRFMPSEGRRSMEGRCQHFNQGQLVFYIDGDSAEAEGYSFVLIKESSTVDELGVAAAPSIQVYAGNFNHWRFGRVEGEWRIVERLVRPLASQEAADVLARTQD
jgi:hypothetical protein